MLGAAAGVLLFHCWGNATRGYIDTASLWRWWSFQWLDPQSETEHGWLILGLSGWLLVRNVRARTPGPRDAGTDGPGTVWPAAAAMAAGLALHAVGFAAQQGRVSIVALLVFAWGVLRLGGGRRWGAAAVFPLGFMLFAIPINVLDSVGFWLRLWVVEAATPLARAAGVEVGRTGTQLIAPDGAYHYDVAAACSGVRSLTALAALSLLAGYLNFATWGRRAAIFALCFPLVYAGNVARILAIVFAAEAGGPAWGDRAHEAMGFGVFAIVLGGVLAAIAALQRWAPESGAAAGRGVGPAGTTVTAEAAGAGRVDANGEPADGGGDGVAPAGTAEQAPADGRATVRAAWAVAALIVAAAAGEAVFLRQLATRPATGRAGVALAPDGKDPVALPEFLGIEWTGRTQPVSAVEREVLPADTGYSRRLYFSHRDPAKQVFLSIVLSGRDRTSIHRPELCLVGQGWTIAGTETRTFRYPGGQDAAGAGGAAGTGGGTMFPVTLLRVRREVPTARGPAVVPQLVAYWFVNADTVVASHWGRMWHDATNRVLRGRVDRWAYVLAQTDAGDGEAAALARIQAVLDGTLPAFQLVSGGR